MHSIRRKLRNHAGETLAETLVGLLIASLALLMLAGAISATARIIETSDNKMGKYYVKDAELANRSSAITGDAVMKISGEGISENHTVKYYINDEFSNAHVAAYQKTING